MTGCATPIQVERAGSEAERGVDANVISTGELSEPTRIVLHQQDLSERQTEDPDATIALLHQRVAGGGMPDAFYALAELSYRRALASGRPADALAAAVYAYRFLFPDDPNQRPSGFDPRFRAACVIYNRGLVRAFATADGTEVNLRSGTFELPFGSIDIAFEASSVRWGGVRLNDFTSADSLSVVGLDALYRRPGIGASLAAGASSPSQEGGWHLEPNVRIPVTALLRMDRLDRDLRQGHLKGSLEIYPAFEPKDVMIAGQSVPLETDTSKAFGISLSDPKVWESEFAGFLDGDFFDRTSAQLVGLEPYRPDQIPVVFIHGTGSGAGRWANLINDLQGDPTIREGFQFWSFSYATGNPTSFSAEQLRDAIEAAVHTLDPQGKNPALQQIVLIGHSQGGLLAKWVSIDSGSRLWDVLSSKPPEQLRLSAEAQRLLRRVFFVRPMAQVRRVIFIATPQRGSFVAESTIGQLLGQLVTPGDRILKALRDLTDDNDELSVHPGTTPSDSVWSMSPTNPLLQVFASIPVSPTVTAHSIIAVQGNGPVEAGDDGVVSYHSAHINEAASELVVRAGHSVQSDPSTVAEVRRILLLHLASVCRDGCKPSAGPLVQGSRR